MNKTVNSLFNICFLEELARRDEWINAVHPAIKLLITFFYIISVASVGKYQIALVLMYGIYPVLIITLTELPLRQLLQKMILPALAGASLGILNPWLDTSTLAMAPGVMLSAGWISLLALFIKSTFSVLAALILVATTKVEDIAGALYQLKLPRIMTIQFQVMFRYITLLVHEVDRTLTAYNLRSGGQRAVGYQAWGSMVGQLFMRTSKRSVELYNAMKLRGFKGDVLYEARHLMTWVDGIYFFFWIAVLGLLGIVRG